MPIRSLVLLSLAASAASTANHLDDVVVEVDFHGGVNVDFQSLMQTDKVAAHQSLQRRADKSGQEPVKEAIAAAVDPTSRSAKLLEMSLMAHEILKDSPRNHLFAEKYQRPYQAGAGDDYKWEGTFLGTLAMEPWNLQKLWASAANAKL